MHQESPGYQRTMTSRATRPAAAAVAALAALALTGCGSTQAEAVRATARAFYAAHAAGDGARACDRLAPRTRSELAQAAGRPCATAVLEEDVPPVDEPLDVIVFGTQAEVSWDGETTFLSRFRGGWKVMAAACEPRPRQPYDCSISGG